MSKEFNLLSLHQPEDIHPRTWICLKGLRLKTIFKNLENDALRDQGWRREKLSKELANRLGCAHTTIKGILQGKHEFYPIPIILELLKFSKNKKKFLREFKKDIEYLKVNSASAKPVRAVYKLNGNLAKILGAFMADGSLSIQVVIATVHLKGLEETKKRFKKMRIRYSAGNAPSRNQYYISIQINKDNYNFLSEGMFSLNLSTQTHYSIELTDEYEDNVEAFVRWVKEEFNIAPNSFKRRGNAWRAIFSNKILARYLTTFFEVKPGLKTYTAFEPTIIKRAALLLRKAFARGVLMFDGCVTIDKKILFSVRSKNLINSIAEIWEKDKIKFGKSISQRGERFLFTTRENTRKKLSKYFEQDTQKWKLLNWLSGNLRYAPILKDGHSFSIKKTVKLLQKIKVCDAIFLKKHFKRSHTTIRSCLKILRDQRKIRLSNRPSRINDYVDANTTILLKNKFHGLIFKNIRKGFGKDKNFAKFLGIHKATISAWRVRKNRIPFCVLKKMCKILNIDLDKLSKNIAKTDREIVEII